MKKNRQRIFRMQKRLSFIFTFFIHFLHKMFSHFCCEHLKRRQRQSALKVEKIFHFWNFTNSAVSFMAKALATFYLTTQRSKKLRYEAFHFFHVAFQMNYSLSTSGTFCNIKICDMKCFRIRFEWKSSFKLLKFFTFVDASWNSANTFPHDFSSEL